MVVMFNVTDPVEREHAMANRKATPARLDWKAVLTSDADGFRALLQTVVQEVLEAEMTEALQAEKNERTASRLGHRSGYYERKLVTRCRGAGTSRTAGPGRSVLNRAVRALPALGASAGSGAGGDVCARGFDPQKPALAKAGVKAITEELCGHSFSASSISAMNQGLDASLAQFAGRPLAEAFPI